MLAKIVIYVSCCVCYVTDVVSSKQGDVLRVAPEVVRQLFAGDEEGIEYLCIQCKKGSLEQFTMNDGVILE